MRSWHLLLAGLLLAVSVWFVLAPGGDAGGPLGQPATGSGDAETAGPGAGGPTEAALPADGGATRVEEASLPGDAAATIPPLPPIPGAAAQLRVRVVDGSGAPAEDVEVTLRVEIEGRAEDDPAGHPWTPWRGELQVAPDEDGEVRVAVPAGRAVGLQFGGPLWTRADRQVQALRAQESVDLGEVALAPASRLHGVVSDTQGAPVAGAQITVKVATASQWYGGRSWDAESAADGSWSVEGLPAGRFRIEAWAQGYAAAVEPGLEVERAGLELVHDIALQPGRSLRGLVLDPDRNPVAGARVYLLRSPEEGWWGEWRPPPPDEEDGPAGAVSGADGSFTLPGWQDDGRGHAVAAAAEGHRPGHADVEDPAGTLVVTLERHLRVSGRVVDAEGEAVPGARVRLLQPRPWGGDPQEIDAVETDAAGAFSCQARDAGEYELSVDSAVGVVVRNPLQLDRDRDDLLLTVAPSSDLLVAVRDVDGAPVANAEVRIWSRGTARKGRAVLHDSGVLYDAGASDRIDLRERTDERGEVRFPGLPPGEMRLTVSARGLERHVEDLERTAEAQRHEVELQVGAGLVVLVSEPGGAPVRGLPVALKHADSGEEAGDRQTDSAGRAVWSDLAPGVYQVAYRAQDAEGGWWRSRDNQEQAVDHPLVELVAGETVLLPVQVGDLALATVVVHRQGVPAAAVLVRLESVEDAERSRWADANRGTPTDGRGEVELQPVEPGTYDLVVKPGRDAPASRRRVELHGGAQRLEFELEGAMLRGRVLGAAGGLAGVRMSLLPAEALETGDEDPRRTTTVIGYASVDGGVQMRMGFLDEMQSTTRSGADGDYAFRDVPDGDWVLVARADGYGTWTSLPITVRGGSTVRVPDQRLMPAAVVHGRDLAHQPREQEPNSFTWGEQVTLLDGEQGVAMAQLGAEGEYRIGDLAAGEYRLRKGNWTSEPFRLAAGQTLRVDIPLPEENPR